MPGCQRHVCFILDNGHSSAAGAGRLLMMRLCTYALAAIPVAAPMK
jgi:hypothetical protein